MSVIPLLKDGEQKVFFKAGREWCYLWTPETFRKDKPVPVVIHHHGARGYVRESSADWLDEEAKVAFLKAVMAGGKCAVAGSHACGDHWGNADAVAANAALYKALTESTYIDSKRVGLMGGGLGGALIWNSILGPLAGRVKSVVVMQAVASLASVIREHRFKDVCLKAYGLPADMPDEEAIKRIAPHDPLPKLQRLAKGPPLPRTIIYHGAKDANIPPETSAMPLAEALKKAGANVTLELFPDVEHSTYAMGKAMEDRLKAFFGSAL